VGHRAAIARRLAEIDQANLRRVVRLVTGTDISSNDYLGMAHHPEVSRAMREAMLVESAGSTGSRLISGHRAAWSELEQTFASWQGTEAALAFSTGWAMNTGTLPALATHGDVLICDELNHASLIDGARLSKAKRVIVPHNDIDAFVRAIRNATPAPGGAVWVVVEAVYSMDGDLAPLAQLAAACSEVGAGLLVDEAHATGLTGPEGQGLVAELGLRDHVAATLHPCGKALGVGGGVVCADVATVDLLVHHARPFVFSTANPPAMAAGLLQALQLIRADHAARARPAALGARLREALAGHFNTGRSASHIVPLITGSPASALALQESLAERGWHARAIRPPTVSPGSSRLRVVLRADLTDADIDRLIADLLALAPTKTQGDTHPVHT
jgi:8-amino-7-oxononanoate synthase